MKLKNQNNVKIYNYGFGSRCPKNAVLNATRDYYASYASASQMNRRFQFFLKFCESAGRPVKDLRDITQSLVVEYASHISSRYKSNQISLNTAHNYIASVNKVMQIVRHDKKIFISAIRQAGLPKRNHITTENKASDKTLEDLMSGPHNRNSALKILNRCFGLRFEESAKVNSAELLKEALTFDRVTITKGTKGGRSRVIPITKPIQLLALEIVVSIQGSDKSLIGKKNQYIEFSRQQYSENKGDGYHRHRHANAQERYLELTGAECPLRAKRKHGKEHIEYLAKELALSITEAKLKDREARLVISRELGHTRIQITNTYLG